MECPICLQEDLDKNMFCYTDCEHSICKECFDKWLDKGERSCPICRNQIKSYNYQGNNYRIVLKFTDRYIQPTIRQNIRIINYKIYRMSLICNGISFASIFVLLGLTSKLYFDYNKLKDECD